MSLPFRILKVATENRIGVQTDSDQFTYDHSSQGIQFNSLFSRVC